MRALTLTTGIVIALFACAKAEPTPTSSTTALPPNASTSMSPPSAPPSNPPSATADASSHSSVAKVDPVDGLVAELSASPMWNNGGFPKIDLPASTPIADVVATVFKNVSFDKGRVTSHRVVSTKSVTIGREPSPHTAVVVETNQGPKIVLLQHGPSGWWSRVYPIKDP